MAYRTERDSMGEMQVEQSRLWGAQTQRSYENFPIGTEKMPREILLAFSYMKEAAAEANHALQPEKLTEEKRAAIASACREIREGKLWDHFPLAVWQTGSGTQSNMNVNEVVARRGSEIAAGVEAPGAGTEVPRLLHPNDDVNMSQSSNDTFPTAMHIAGAVVLSDRVIPAVRDLAKAFGKLEQDYAGILKTGRTHLMDAVPLTFAQEISGWRVMLEKCGENLERSLPGLYEIALGGTAVGTGLNAPEGFPRLVAEKLAALTGKPFVSEPNKFHALTGRDALVFAHGGLKALAADLMKIANDIRWLASGPRCGIGEITIPANEPGSSIMPGKVNPTQCEAVTMAAVQVMGNDAAIGFAASQGNFQLNVFMPVMAYNFLQSAGLLADVCDSFRLRCVSGIRPNEARMQENLNRSLMLVTALNPRIGYEKAAEVAHLAFSRGITLKEAAASLGYLTPEEFDETVRPEGMV